MRKGTKSGRIVNISLEPRIVSKSPNQNTGEYRLHFFDVEISAFISLLTPGVLYQTHTRTHTLTNKQSTVTLAAHARRGLITHPTRLPPISAPGILYLELYTLIEIVEQPYWFTHQTTVVILISLLTDSSVLCEYCTRTL